ncbi:protein involved in gliding motility SprE [Nonlabens sp. Hel1_33_55]|uniref:type IX secretion system periplasmic lipoprotein PorW/SprE n=1 Tax=Nonlabens sp. Hel1_33_55 TaxID=1336802 RepID=UPI000875D229|nr:hypothetical protein [Nonlabens sp. Hel1_33_55]SCY34584.1 protein involved in gliding motility SprE [Nonlabens sp. Hel1_33_55]
MKNIFAFTTIIFCLLLILASCSRKNDSFISRNLHAVGTEYNVLYNGNLALQAGLDNIEASYRDNYWDILPVERLTVKEAIRVSADDQSDPNFELAEEKAVKAVQKHSMLIDGEEVNPQIDEAYMLLGKARYYDQRFIPSLEAFNYVLQFMPESDEIRMAKIWREKTNMRLENNEIAIENLQELIKEDSLDIKREELILANATLAQAYLNVDKVDSALIYMNRAAQKTKVRATEGRYKYIAGQLFAKAGQRDSAIAHFDEVIELHRKIPRNYYVNAFIEKIKLRDTIEQSDEEFLEVLNELEENRENRPWLDIINYRKAIYLESKDSVDGAIAYYNRSLKAGNRDPYLQGNTYDALGRISFDDARFETAGKYFDSASTRYEDKSREQRAVLKKRENLADIILYENNRRSADSVLGILALSDIERESYYSNYIEEIKAREAQLAEQAAIEEANLAQQKTALATVQTNNAVNRNRLGPPSGAGIDDLGPSSSTNSGFYFYIPATVARGKLQFRAVWGNRALKDNWNLTSLSSNLIDEATEGNVTAINNSVAPEYLASYYIDQLPQGQVALDSIADSRDFAYYQLGVLYKEKFKRNDLAINRFEKLLTFEPEEKLLLPTLYNLYLMGRDGSGDGNDLAFAKAEQYKSTIISQYPETRYAQILQNPTGTFDNSETAEGVYNIIFKQYEQENFATVIEQANNQIIRFAGDPIIPKLELLKTYASGRLYGFQAYKDGLDFIALNYPSSEVGQEAATLAADAEKLAIPSEFAPEENSTNFKLVYQIDATNDQLISDLKTGLAQPIESLGNNISYSIDVYTPEQSLLVIHGMNSKEKAAQVATYLDDPDNNVELPSMPVAISSDNYKIVQVYKSLNDYMIKTL